MLTVDRLSELLVGSSMDISLLSHHNHMEVEETSESVNTCSHYPDGMFLTHYCFPEKHYNMIFLYTMHRRDTSESYFPMTLALNQYGKL